MLLADADTLCNTVGSFKNPAIFLPNDMKFQLNLPLSTQAFAIPALIIFLSIAAYFIPDNWQQQLIYQRTLINEGEIWRLVTGHFLHTNGYHLALNCAAVFLVWALHGDYYNVKNTAMLTLFTIAFTSTLLFILAPQLISYVGLSGILHGFFIWGAIEDIKSKFLTGYLLFFGVIAKVSHEQIYGADTAVAELINANVAIDAHLYGAISGLISAALIAVLSKAKNKASINSND
jgi:rhomboid family GlyGly-CTERM serine protease